MAAVIGLVMAIIGGIMGGSFTVPMKRITKWEWENLWLVWSTVALLLVPWAIAFCTVPDLLSVYARSGTGTIVMVYALGFGFGMGVVLFGLGNAMIGIGLTFAIANGLSTALGSLIPMAVKPSVFATAGGATVALGVALLIAGVVVCAVAGTKRDAMMRKTESGSDAISNHPSRGLFLKGLLIAFLSGILNPLINYAFNFGAKVKEQAVISGASLGSASDAIWALALLGTFTVNVGYCVYLLCKKKTWSKYVLPATGTYWLFALAMGLIWMLSVTIYGRAAVMMGDLGGSAGWGIWMGCVVLTSNVWGLLTGEWSAGKGAPLRTMYSGLALLLIGIAVTGYGNSLFK